MRKLSVILVCLMILSIVSACATAIDKKHSFYYQGISSDEVLAKLGPPTRVNKSTRGTEVWEYDEQDWAGFGTYFYYINKDGKAIKRDLRIYKK